MARMRTGVAVLEVTAALASFDFSTADRWEVLVLYESVPVARVHLPSPGRVDSADLARTLFWPHAEPMRSRAAAERHLRARLQADLPPAPPQPTCSVVLCTRGRPDHLATALAGLAELDPAPLEVIVVDNDPGERSCQAEVRKHGFVYLREDRRGLDNARNAGVRTARGDVIVFTDDDCVFPAGWLRALGGAFADPLVGAVTGPAFPYALDTPARIRMERQASLTRGLMPRTLDWTLVSALHAGQAGVGANMAIRGDLLRAVHEPFPPELDGGTQTRSGGDTYLFIRLLAAGHRIAYEPALFVFHQHRSHWAALDEALTGYGIGVVATQIKLLVEDGEFEAPRAALWLLSQYSRTQWRRLVRRVDAVDTRLAWLYVRGGLVGVQAWREALSTQRAIDPGMRPAAPFPPPTARPLRAAAQVAAAPPAASPNGATGLAISVIVPTVDRPATLARCLAALADQTLAQDAYEVIVIDDAPEPTVPDDCGATRVHRTGGQGAAMARNAGAQIARGELLLFLDDDLIATPALLERHVAAHAADTSETVVIGYSPPRPPRPGLAALGAALWWEDQFRAYAEAGALTFTEALSGNVSLRRAAFLDGRSFEPAFARLRREDWEWGYRLLDGGARLVYEPSAVAGHEYELDAGQRIGACRLEARGDALLAERHPRAAPYLPLAWPRGGRPRSPRAVVVRVLGAPRAEPAVLAVLDVLERARLRGAWSALYKRAQREAYAHGLREAGWRSRPVGAPPVLDVQAWDTEPLPAPRVTAPVVRVWHEGRQVAHAGAAGPWRPHLAATLAHRMAAAGAVPAGDGEAPMDEGSVLELPWPDDWPAALRALEASPASVVAFVLPGRVSRPGWLQAIAPVFVAPRVALAIGQLLETDSPPEPLTLHEAWRDRLPYAPLGGPADYLVLRRDALDALRRASAFSDHGPMAVALACLEDVMRSGALVAHRNVHGLTAANPALTRGEREREKLTAWGALLGEYALARPPARALGASMAMAVGEVARSALRRRRDDAQTPLSQTAASRAVVTGWARAVSRRRASGAPAERRRCRESAR